MCRSGKNILQYRSHFQGMATLRGSAVYAYDFDCNLGTSSVGGTDVRTLSGRTCFRIWQQK